MPWTPRGGKALSRAASGRVPGPRTTNSCVKGTMLLIIFVTLLKIASFEHSLRGAAAAAHRIGLDLEDVEFAAHLAQPVVERAEAFVEQVETAAARDVAYARSHLAQPVLEHAGAFFADLERHHPIGLGKGLWLGEVEPLEEPVTKTNIRSRDPQGGVFLIV